MVATIRNWGRWAKRKYRETLMALSPSSRKKRHNERLNRREFWHGLTRLRSYPLFVQVGTNWTCNLRCPFCRREVEPYREQLRTLPPEKREISSRVLEELNKILPYAIRFSLTPLGDPLLYTGLEDILETHRRLGCENLSLTTNGALLTDRRCELLVKSRVESIAVSVDTPDPERYRSMRKGTELSVVIDGIKRLEEWKKKLQSSLPRLVFASTFMRTNIGDLRGMIDLARELDIEAITLQLMDPENPDLEPEMLWHHIPLTIRILSEAVRYAREKGVRLDFTIAFINLISSVRNKTPELSRELFELLPNLDTREKTLVEKCRLPWESLLVDTDGDVRPCCWAAIRFGNLNTETLQEVWNGPQAMQMRRMFLENIIPGGCRNKHCRVDI